MARSVPPEEIVRRLEEAYDALDELARYSSPAIDARVNLLYENLTKAVEEAVKSRRGILGKSFEAAAEILIRNIDKVLEEYKSFVASVPPLRSKEAISKLITQLRYMLNQVEKSIRNLESRIEEIDSAGVKAYMAQDMARVKSLAKQKARLRKSLEKLEAYRDKLAELLATAESLYTDLETVVPVMLKAGYISLEGLTNEQMERLREYLSSHGIKLEQLEEKFEKITRIIDETVGLTEAAGVSEEELSIMKEWATIASMGKEVLEPLKRLEERVKKKEEAKKEFDKMVEEELSKG